jgi:hypothetical protein
MRKFLQALAGRLGYRLVRANYLGRLRSQLESAHADLLGYQAALSQTTTDLTGFKCAYEKTSAELAGYRTAYAQVSAQLGRYKHFLRDSVRKDRTGRQVGFLHIQKTGGISLLHFLGSRFEEWRTLWVFSPRELERYHANELEHFDLVCGHFSYCNVFPLRARRTLCTFLRHPVDRVLSCYWYFRTYRGPMRDIITAGVAAAREKSLREFLEDRHPEVRCHVANHQTYTLADDWTRPGKVADALEAATRHLDDFACVGLTERMEESLDLLCRELGWKRDHSLPRLNQTPYRQSAEDIRPAERDRILELNALDLALYEHARQRLERDLTSPAGARRAA